AGSTSTATTAPTMRSRTAATPGRTAGARARASSCSRAHARCGGNGRKLAAWARALVLLLVALGAMAAGVLIGRYYVPDDRQLRRTARHARAYMRAGSHLIARDHDPVVDELRRVVEENIDDVEPYFALGALFR